MRGTLHSVDQYLNIKLLNVSVDDVENYPHMVRAAASAPAARPPAQRARRRPTPPTRALALAPQQSVKNCFIRGSVIKYVQLPSAEVDTELLQDATRREVAQQKSGGK